MVREIKIVVNPGCVLGGKGSERGKTWDTRNVIHINTRILGLPI